MFLVCGKINLPKKQINTFDKHINPMNIAPSTGERGAKVLIIDLVMNACINAQRR
jgi:hypothetical protein